MPAIRGGRVRGVFGGVGATGFTGKGLGMGLRAGAGREPTGAFVCTRND